MSYYPGLASYVRDKVKVVLDLSREEWLTKKELGHTTGIDTSDLTAKKIF